MEDKKHNEQSKVHVVPADADISFKPSRQTISQIEIQYPDNRADVTINVAWDLNDLISISQIPMEPRIAFTTRRNNKNYEVVLDMKALVEASAEADNTTAQTVISDYEELWESRVNWLGYRKYGRLEDHLDVRKSTIRVKKDTVFARSAWTKTYSDGKSAYVCFGDQSKAEVQCVSESAAKDFVLAFQDAMDLSV